MELERQRGITIRSAVVSFVIDDVTVNRIDTRGHPDFIAEVERVLSVLDGAVLVISAVGGVQAQTRVLLRTLRRLRIATLIFVNKLDGRGARHESLLRNIAHQLTPSILALDTARADGSAAGRTARARIRARRRARGWAGTGIGRVLGGPRARGGSAGGVRGMVVAINASILNSGLMAVTLIAGRFSTNRRRLADWHPPRAGVRREHVKGSSGRGGG